MIMTKNVLKVIKQSDELIAQVHQIKDNIF